MPAFQPSRGRARPAARTRAARTPLLGAALLWIALLALPGTPLAQGTGFAATAQPQPELLPPEDRGPGYGELNFLVEAPELWLPAWHALLADPDAARETLRGLLPALPSLPYPQRVLGAVARVGQPTEIPLLLEQLQAETRPHQRALILDAVRALYDRSEPVEDLSFATRDFSFTRAPSPQLSAGIRPGNRFLSGWSLEQLHAGGLQPTVVQTLSRLQGQDFRSVDALQAAAEKALKPRVWRQVGERVLEVVETEPQWVSVGGIVRVELGNPAPRPVLFHVQVLAWGASPLEPMPPHYVYLEPEEIQSFDQTVSLRAPRGQEQLRLSLRVREFGGQIVPAYQKLYVPLEQ